MEPLLKPVPSLDLQGVYGEKLCGNGPSIAGLLPQLWARHRHKWKVFNLGSSNGVVLVFPRVDFRSLLMYRHYGLFVDRLKGYYAIKHMLFVPWRITSSILYLLLHLFLLINSPLPIFCVLVSIMQYAGGRQLHTSISLNQCPEGQRYHSYR